MPKKGSKLPECERGCLNKDGKLKHHGPARCEKRKAEAIKAKEFTSIYFLVFTIDRKRTLQLYKALYKAEYPLQQIQSVLKSLL